ncbi:MAG: hypothetical protein IJT70_08320 [Clostridia bacterium]|nr:hypothetical protein [Clostridia bacterium]
MKHKRLSLTAKYTAIVCAILIVAISAVSAVLMIKSSRTMRSLLRRHMISVAYTASASIDGDFLKRMTEDDVGSVDFIRVAKTLLLIKDAQKDSDIKFIYAVKREGDGYVFTVDPDRTTPPISVKRSSRPTLRTPPERAPLPPTRISTLRYCYECNHTYYIWVVQVRYLSL